MITNQLNKYTKYNNTEMNVVSNSDDIRQFIIALPKAELHIHLEGTILPSTIVELSERRRLRDAASPDSAASSSPALTLVEAEKIYKYTTFSEFIDSFVQVIDLLCDASDYELIAWRMIQSLAQQGIVHAEVFISIGIIYRYKTNLDVDKVFEALEQARQRGAEELGMSIYWIFDAARHEPFEDAIQVFRKAISLHVQYPSIIGIGLGGDERHTRSSVFANIFQEAKEAGLRLTNHAGETTGPDAIWEALSIGSERLGHIYSARDDPELMKELKNRKIPVEINPTSNIQLGICPSYAVHPLKEYFDAGLFVTLNSDDPAFFGANLVDEYLHAYEEFHFTKEELITLATHSFEASFLPDDRKRHWINQIEQLHSKLN